MHKKINFYMLLICAVSITFTALVSVNLFYMYESRMKAGELDDTARIIAAAYDREQIYEVWDALSTTDVKGQRLTVISPDGEILFDSVGIREGQDFGLILTMPEVEMAFREGVGESRRHSYVVQEDVYCSAILLADGSVLRIMEASSNVVGILLKILPILMLMAFLIFLMVNLLAKKLTRLIVDPINKIDVDAVKLYGEAVYEEITPLIQAIMTQRRVMAEQLVEMKKQANTFKALTMNMNEGMIVLDGTGHVLSANPSAMQTMDIGTLDGSSVHIGSLVPEPVFSEAVQDALAGNSADIYLSVGASTKQVFFNPVLSDDELLTDAVSGVVIFIVDITEKARAEKNRQDFSANVSHELKTPLTTILGYAELIETGLARKEDINGFAKKITGEVQRLIGLIESIIKLSGMDEGAAVYQFEEFNLFELAADVAGRFNETARQAKVCLNVSGDQAEIFADRMMIDELLMNLVQNAINYNVPGGKVEVILSKKDMRVQIQVVDTGIGIHELDLEHIFERFYRVDKSRSKKTGGTGLGLAIVKHIVMYHGGHVKFESKESAGSIVTVTI